ncbi:hypothetical protein AB0N12_14390 [Streptomyces albogriseolus]|uniref:hypothetical protein n=1 Tax=Streptomyces albogriseolus TaxID=1887 RepID=UPI003460D0D4
MLDEKRLPDKVVEAGRGGFRHERNGAVGAWPTALGHGATLLAALPLHPSAG